MRLIISDVSTMALSKKTPESCKKPGRDGSTVSFANKHRK